MFTKTGHGGTDKVWFYNMEADGLSLDVKRTEVEENDIPDILARWQNLDDEENRTRKDKSFFVPVEEIRNNNYDISINKYKEIAFEQKVYRPSKVITADIEMLQKEMAIDLAKIMEMLK